MPIIIDGHNLIPKIPGIRLSDHDDEMQLVELLQNYSRLRRRGVIECYFDKAPSGYPRRRRFGLIQVQFAPRGSSADADIEKRLQALKREARNWTVVSSDQRVRQAARSVGATDITSEEFTQELFQVLESEASTTEPSGEYEISDPEMEMWLDLFGQNETGDVD